MYISDTGKIQAKMFTGLGTTMTDVSVTGAGGLKRSGTLPVADEKKSCKEGVARIQISDSKRN